MQKNWDTIKRSNLTIIGIEEGTENIFNKITEEQFPSIKKDMSVKVHEAYKTPNRLEKKEDPLSYNNQSMYNKHTE